MVHLPIIVIPRENGVMVMSRTNPKYVILNPKTFALLEDAYGNNVNTPEWFSNIVREQLCINIDNRLIRDAIVLHSPSKYDYATASWELNLLCNYHCLHCYLGDKQNVSMTLRDRMTIIERMQELGVVRLQLTGGEPLIDKYFEETYAAAYDSGIILTVSTNGSCLHEENILDLFENRPPLRVTVSLYGATATTYEAMTKTLPGTFNHFLRGLEFAAKRSIALRVNIIVSSYNEHEIDAMKRIAEQFTNDVYVYDKMSASIYGDDNPLQVQADNHRCLAERRIFSGCEAGVKSFHVNQAGRASMCKISREPFVQLNREPVTAMSRLQHSSVRQLVRSGDCTECTLHSVCTTCPIIVENYRHANANKLLYCKKDA